MIDRKRTSLAAVLALGLLPARSPAQDLFEATAKLTCLQEEAMATKLHVETLDTNELIAAARSVSPELAKNLYLAYVNDDLVILDRCTNALVLILSQPASCIEASGKSVDRSCSIAFSDWFVGAAVGRALCRVHVGGSTHGSCDGEIEREGLGLCRIQISVHGPHKIPKSCS
ncbi:MAG TPA: hypothetical protein VMR86_14645 [Myxococcota bacterium]|nr:hypothetical protein [Myxococcota bacterium]